jgi:hypothetical protein
MDLTTTPSSSLLTKLAPSAPARRGHICGKELACSICIRRLHTFFNLLLETLILFASLSPTHNNHFIFKAVVIPFALIQNNVASSNTLF